jgi:hypothetical protein
MIVTRRHRYNDFHNRNAKIHKLSRWKQDNIDTRDIHHAIPLVSHTHMRTHTHTRADTNAISGRQAITWRTRRASGTRPTSPAAPPRTTSTPTACPPSPAPYRLSLSLSHCFLSLSLFLYECIHVCARVRNRERMGYNFLLTRILSARLSG